MIQFRPPSVTKPWDAFVAVDPVFVQPPVEPSDDASAEQVDEYKKAIAEYIAKLKAARETGDWTPMLVPGRSLAEATKFTLLPVDANIWRELLDRATLPADSLRRIGSVSMNAVLFRLAVKAISGLETRIEREHDPAWGYVMAQSEIVDILDKEDPRIVGDLGNRIMERLRGVGPLSSKG